MRILFSLLCFLLLSSANLCAQEKELPVTEKKDSLPVIKKAATGSSRYDSALKAHSPRKAAIRSAILPGWGQIYNKKYWKLPIVYGALGTSGGIFFYNLKNYRDTRFAYRVKYNMQYNQTDSALYSLIRANLRPLDIESLKYYRNSFRRDIDYSVLFFLILWGLNVVDATVDAHLKSFDVSPDLSFRFKPGYSETARTSGLSLVVKIGK
ncbi:MAG TPA: DUF5683 domain-containing protein [Chitinophagaceae bacterium]|mgnify:FL=1|nr:DUF5683 domain-containing protein [Chitinophagaceae bacterium]HPH32489.1 DUF5683 domain-containing protein [Chitinophagaceae bacterium]